MLMSVYQANRKIVEGTHNSRYPKRAVFNARCERSSKGSKSLFDS